jgi:HPt (histidine-containing phosphotransfer) domain-containing protein
MKDDRSKPLSAAIADIDLSEIEELAGGDPAMLSELIMMFVRHTLDAIEKTRGALADGKAPEAAIIAHTSIGFTAAIGVATMVPTLRALERAARIGPPEEIGRWLAQWECEFELVREALEARTKSAGRA